MRQHKKILPSLHNRPHLIRRWTQFFRRKYIPSPPPASTDTSAASLIPLNQLKTGERGIVHYLQGGRRFANRVYELGFLPGSEITMLENYGHGPVLVSIRGTRVALGNREAARIQVKVLEKTDEK